MALLENAQIMEYDLASGAGIFSMTFFSIKVVDIHIHYHGRCPKRRGLVLRLSARQPGDAGVPVPTGALLAVPGPALRGRSTCLQ